MNTIYETRTSRVEMYLVRTHGNVFSDSCGYSIDAPEQIPSGSVKGYGRTDDCHYELPAIHSREIVDRSECNEFAKRMISQILIELANTK